MRRAILSDVHANLEALTAVLARIDAEGVDEILCLGDVVGYHADPNACIDHLHCRGVRCIAGNHDLAVLGRKETTYFGEAARRGVLWTRTRLHETSWQFLRELPELLVVGGLLLVHAALHPQPNTDLHLASIGRIGSSLDALRTGGYGVRLAFFGHTHRAGLFTGRGGAVVDLSPGPVEAERVLAPDVYYLVNPGSVGQPRDGDPRAAFVLFDSESRALRFCRVEYDVTACLRKAEAAGLLVQDGLVRRSAYRLRQWVDQGKEEIRRRLGG